MYWRISITFIILSGDGIRATSYSIYHTRKQYAFMKRSVKRSIFTNYVIQYKRNLHPLKTGNGIDDSPRKYLSRDRTASKESKIKVFGKDRIRKCRMKHAGLYVWRPPWKAVPFSPCVYMCIQNPNIEQMSLEIIKGCMFSNPLS